MHVENILSSKRIWFDTLRRLECHLVKFHLLPTIVEESVNVGEGFSNNK
jgi:hypothetical protein